MVWIKKAPTKVRAFNVVLLTCYLLTPPVVALPVVNVQPCPAGWETLPGFGSNANHCWWSQYENPRCVGVDMQMIGVGYVFDRSSGTPTRTEDPGNMWTSESNSPSCGGSSSSGESPHCAWCIEGAT